MRTRVPSALLAAVLGLGIAAAPRAAQAQMFTQCPRVGANTGCGGLITIGSGGVLSIAIDNTQGPYDGSDDALIGVVNRSGMTINSMTLTTGTDAFGFDGDGLCAYITCSWAHPTGYEGPGMSFSNITANYSGGTITFAGGLADGASTFFSLEETPAAIAAPGIGGGATSTAPEPATLGLVAVGLGLAAASRRRRVA